MRFLNATISGVLGVADAYKLQNGTNGGLRDPFDADDVKKEFYVALATGLAGLLFSVLTALYSCVIDRRMKAYEAKLELQKERQTRIEDMNELMKQYRKPLVQSAFDLQSRLAQEVRGDLLQTFHSQQGRRQQYALLSTLYLICEFLGWLEVIHQEIVFITGKNAATLNQILDAIKFQFSGETEIQGAPNRSATKQPDADERDWNILQIFGVELRSIGEVMLDVRTYDDDKETKSTGLSVIGYAEFCRRYNKQPPKPEDFGVVITSADGEAAAAASGGGGGGGDGGEAMSNYAEALERWNDSKEKLLQDTILPLTRSVKKLMEANPDNKPKARMAMLQVLLCKLIDFLDEGEKGEDNSLVEERYLARNDRITPLVARLTPEALRWLATRPFMEDCTEAVDPMYRKQWLDMVSSGGEWNGVPLAAYRRVAFPGFREDCLVGWNKFVGRQTEDTGESSTEGDAPPPMAVESVGPVVRFRELQKKLLGTDTFFPGAFPPKIRRSTLRHPYYWLPMQLRRLGLLLYQTCHLCFTGVPPLPPEDPLIKEYQQRDALQKQQQLQQQQQQRQPAGTSSVGKGYAGGCLPSGQIGVRADGRVGATAAAPSPASPSIGSRLVPTSGSGGARPPSTPPFD